MKPLLALVAFFLALAPSASALTELRVDGANSVLAFELKAAVISTAPAPPRKLFLGIPDCAETFDLKAVDVPTSRKAATSLFVGRADAESAFTLAAPKRGEKP